MLMNEKPIGVISRLLSSNLVVALFGLLCAGLFCLAIIVTYYNILFSVTRITTIFRENADADYLNQSASLVPDWVLPLMQDLSVVSPILVAFTLLCMTYGGILLLRASHGIKSVGSHFPFPTAYKGYYIQIGLIGTIVGFVIAFSNINPSLKGQSEVLLDALGTALWSTLTAITLAYVICPLVELLWQWWLRVRTGYDPNPDTLSALEELRMRTVSATESLDSFARSVSTLSTSMDTLQLQNRLTKLDQRLAEIGLDIATLKDHAGILAERTRELRGRVEALENQDQEQARSIDDLSARQTLTKTTIEANDRRLDDLEKTVAKLLNQLKRALE